MTECEHCKTIDLYAKEEKDFEIQNNSDVDVVYVLKIIFQNAIREVCMFVPNFDSILNNRKLAEEAVKFLQNPEARLKIAYRDQFLKKREDFLEVCFLRVILGAGRKGKIEIWDARKFDNRVNNDFFCNDRGHFRYTVTQGNSVANFGDRKIGIKLAKIFATIITECPKIWV